MTRRNPPMPSVGDKFVVPLPVVRPPLMMNDRRTWQAHSRQVKLVRQWALIAANHANLPQGLGRVRIDLVWLPVVNRVRDTDGPTPTRKASVDGIVTDWGLCADDDRTRVEGGCVVLDPDRAHRGPRVWLEITYLGDQPRTSDVA